MKRLIGCIASIAGLALVIGLLIFWIGGSSPAKKLMKEQPYTFSTDKSLGQMHQESYVEGNGCVYIAYPKTDNKATNEVIKQYVEEVKKEFDAHRTEAEENKSDLIPRLVLDYSNLVWESFTELSFRYEIADMTKQGTSAGEPFGGKKTFYIDAKHNVLDLNGLLGEDSEKKINIMLKSSGKSTEGLTTFTVAEDTLTLHWADGKETLSVSAIRRAGVIDPDKPMIALTFDDGPGRYSRDFADLLTRYGARATFFVLGSNVKNFADDLKYVYEQGNEIASHTMNHKNLNLLSSDDIRKEIEDAEESIYDAIGAYPTLIRTPFGNANSKVMDIIDGPMIKWSVDTLDWKTRNAQSVKEEIIEGAGDGEIILLHEIYQSSLDGLEMALKELSKEDYQFVTVSELMQYRGVTPQCEHYYSFKK